MATTIPLRLVSHNRKIANLYKKWIRTLEGNTFSLEEKRYKIALARCEFDAILNEKDMRKSKKMLIDKEQELCKTFVLPQIYFPDSPNGSAYGREVYMEDWIIDYWHPLEKAMYPDYFARRELRKQQFIEMWEKVHGPPPPRED